MMASRVIGSTSAAGKTPKPSRQPVMAKVLDQPSSRIVRSAMPSTSRTLACWPHAVADGPVHLVGEHGEACRNAISAIASQSSRVSALPHGLCGELMMSSLDRSVTSRASSSVSMRKPLPSRSGTGTGTPPRTR